ncbi:bacillithiol system redox-active protein YtxJ [Aurantibacillus circumpalustris]|uniref:bacillithiol system redox-active protein YtxJ n=1 Tax=Aurantibacillus circumpalustris TaxID=3036359 RepID=UPI00295A8258|nr:bacillithiol system redox-active protein YtxJ [Aurantibacillus circumpalustris]
MNWNELSTLNQLEQIDELSKTKPVLILKHSTTCSISRASLGRIERTWSDENTMAITPYYLDLLAYRNISNKIAQRYGVTHESPQILLIKNGKSVYSESHMAINVAEILEQVSK